ncbi:alkylation response protein AidB-like acyl-CoA dehydrogenase [Halarchaeum solikamskense]|uniref:acyl-CoA dehydrogenase family protein n=1 Tax=Halarchaeum nitratireducens TaxID=489913 RepID=UPI001B3A9DD8|nr:acyl-CoA dehydrogenase family protein [Halarchaeum solikamskense]MBP2249999.1 alkylation response protein AidB-like acyl-CoA dehydrogenase [Halarchaeum solikamskense]
MELLDESPVPAEVREAKRDARAFAREHVEPNAARHFADGTYPREVVEAAVEADLVGIEISEAYGGRGASLRESLAVTEELFRADAGIGMAIRGRSFGTNVLERYGTDEQKERYLPGIPSGESFTGMAISEPETGSDLAGMTTRAEREGDEWVVDGEKYWIGNGIDADWVLTYVKTEETDDRHANHSLVVVPTDAPGYAAEHIPEKIGMRASQQAHIVFDDCRVPAENLVGERGEGFRMVAEFFDHGRISAAGHGLGIAAAAIEEAWAFVDDREEFGRPIGEFQSVQHDLADMRTEFESARALTWRAAERVETDEAASDWSAMAKTKATETAVECAETGMRLHGGRGVLDEHRISRLYRDARLPLIYEGVNEVQRDIVYKRSEA